MSKRIVFFHLLNDYSGSPNILSLVIKGLVARGYIVDLYTSSKTGGFLSSIEGVNYYSIYYRFSTNKILTLFLLILVQIRYFFAVLKYIGRKNVVIYINTLLPFGATIGAKAIGKEIIYHVHENPVKKNIITKISVFVFLKNATKAIFVSRNLFNIYEMAAEKKVLVYNSIEPQFTKIAESHYPELNKPERILMVCSLKVYKGVFIFLNLAEMLPQYKFTLVLNASDSEIKIFFNKKNIPKNLKVYSSKTDLHPFYSDAQLVVNLSVVDVCVETFGLTILEAMYYGIPVIIPPLGGITELVDNGINGFLVDSRDLEGLIKKITFIFSDREFYSRLSENSKIKAKQFSYSNMIGSIERLLN